MLFGAVIARTTDISQLTRDTFVEGEKKQIFRSLRVEANQDWQHVWWICCASVQQQSLQWCPQDTVKNIWHFITKINNYWPYLMSERLQLDIVGMFWFLIGKKAWIEPLERLFVVATVLLQEMLKFVQWVFCTLVTYKVILFMALIFCSSLRR